jgi:hypothetical protein
VLNCVKISAVKEIIIKNILLLCKKKDTKTVEIQRKLQIKFFDVVLKEKNEEPSTVYMPACDDQ